MFRLIRWMLSLVLVAGAIYFAVAVPLGEKTLWQHARAIAGSRESQQLADEVKRKAGLGPAPPAAPGQAADEKRGESKASPLAGRDPSSDKLSDEERKLLRKLIRDKLASPPQ